MPGGDPLMHFCVVQVERAGAIFVRSCGIFRAADLQMLFKALGSLDLYHGARILHDMRNVDFSMSMEEVIKVAHAPRGQKLNTRVALVADTEAGFGVLRVIVAIRENASRMTNAFRSVDEALYWLNIPDLGTVFPAGIEKFQAANLPCEAKLKDDFGLIFQKFSVADALGGESYDKECSRTNMVVPGA